MRVENFILFAAATAGQTLVESTAWSFSNIMLSGSKVSHIFSESVAIAAQRGMDECRYQFQWDRWDCPKSSFNVFSKSTSHPATKEMSFLHAILSAAIVITLTRNCSMGHFDTCGCDKSKKGIAEQWYSFGVRENILKGYDDWAWGGCSDNVLIGNKMAKEFLDSKESGRDAKALINLHNNKVGRVLVRKNMRRLCKCHGVSGSCATQTCWMRMQDLREVADNLKASYKSAILVEYNGHGSLMPSRDERKERNRNSISQSRIRIPRNQLIYMEPSPNYCIRNLTASIPGTSRRECSRRKGKHITEAERRSCRTLCRSCGRKVKKSVVIVKSSCKCKFHWCCDVKCEECIEEVTKFYCT